MYKLENRITFRKFNVINWLFSRGINEFRPVKLFATHFFILRHCRTCSGNLNQRGKPVDDTKVMQCGRSMIEMLGVLAIIGVLSVGGIAGYSKAMEKWKADKAINEYSYLIQGLLEHLDDFEKLNNSNDIVDIVNTVWNMNLVPNSWDAIKEFGERDMFRDSLGNTVSIFVRNSRVVFNVVFGDRIKGADGKSISPTFSKQLCREIWSNLIIPLHN